MDPATATSQMQLANLNVSVVAGTVNSTAPAGTVAYTDPAIGTTTTRGQIVKIYLSSGGGVQVPTSILMHGPTVSQIQAWLLTQPGQLSAIGSSGQQNETCGPTDRVTRTSPTPGSYTQTGTVIELFCHH